MTTSLMLTSLTEELAAMFDGPLPSAPSVVIDQPNTYLEFDGPLESITVTGNGQDAQVYGYGDIDRFVLKPYADHVDSWVMGDVERLQTTDNWHADLVIGGDVGRADLEQFDYSDLAVYGNVDRLELFDSRDSDLAFYGKTDQADLTWVQDAALKFNEIGRWLELDGVTDSVVQVGSANDAFVEIEDSEDLTVSVYSADDTSFELSNVDGLDLSIARGDVMVEGDEVEDSSIQTGGGHDYVVLKDVANSTIHTGAGHDSVMLEDADKTAVHTGEGNDFLSFTTADPTAQLAYSLGEGHDFAYIAGGNTLGVTLDGDNDTIVFNTSAGGNHEVMAFFGATVRFVSGATEKILQAWPKFGWDTIRLLVLLGFSLIVYSALRLSLLFGLAVVSQVSLPALLWLVSWGVIFTVVQSLLMYVWPLWSHKQTGLVSIVAKSILISSKDLGRLFIRTLLFFSSVAVVIFLLDGVRLFIVGAIGVSMASAWLTWLAACFYWLLLITMVIAAATVNYRLVGQRVVVPQHLSTAATTSPYLLLGISLIILWLLEDFVRLIRLLNLSGGL